MSLEQSIYELTVAVNKLISIHEKYNEDTGVKMASEYIKEPDLSPLSLAVINLAKMASDGITEPEPTPTPIIKAVKQKPISVFIPAPDETVTNIVEQPVVALDVLEMRDTIRTMCSEMVQGSKENKIGIGAIFSNYKATHLRMVDDATVPALYAELMTFKGSLK